MICAGFKFFCEFCRNAKLFCMLLIHTLKSWRSSWARRGRVDWGWPVWSPLSQGAPGRVGTIVSWEGERGLGLTCLVPNFATGHARRGLAALSAGGEGQRGLGCPVLAPISPQKCARRGWQSSEDWRERERDKGHWCHTEGSAPNRLQVQYPICSVLDGFGIRMVWNQIGSESDWFRIRLVRNQIASESGQNPIGAESDWFGIRLVRNQIGLESDRFGIRCL